MRGKNKMSYQQLNLFNKNDFDIMLLQYVKDFKTYKQGNYTYTIYINMIDNFVYNNDINYLDIFIEHYKIIAYSYMLQYDYNNNRFILTYYTD